MNNSKQRRDTAAKGPPCAGYEAGAQEPRFIESPTAKIE